MFLNWSIIVSIIERFRDISLSGTSHQLILHVALGFSKEADAKVLKQLPSQLFGDVTSLGKHFSKALFEQISNGFAVVSIAWCQSEVEQLTVLVDHHMELENKEPIDRGFAPRRQMLKHSVSSNAPIVTHLLCWWNR